AIFDKAPERKGFKSLKELYQKEQPINICIENLGCSSSELNSLSLIQELINTIIVESSEMAPKSISFEDMLRQQMRDDFGHCFVNGVPGNFYGIHNTNTTEQQQHNRTA
ncbi:Salicylate carboxymethyltransferase, partial [Bienertia sinuspersici]